MGLLLDTMLKKAQSKYGKGKKVQQVQVTRGGKTFTRQQVVGTDQNEKKKTHGEQSRTKKNRQQPQKQFSPKTHYELDLPKKSGEKVGVYVDKKSGDVFEKESGKKFPRLSNEFHNKLMQAGQKKEAQQAKAQKEEKQAKEMEEEVRQYLDLDSFEFDKDNKGQTHKKFKDGDALKPEGYEDYKILTGARFGGHENEERKEKVNVQGNKTVKQGDIVQVRPDRASIKSKTTWAKLANFTGKVVEIISGDGRKPDIVIMANEKSKKLAHIPADQLKLEEKLNKSRNIFDKLSDWFIGYKGYITHYNSVVFEWFKKCEYETIEEELKKAEIEKKQKQFIKINNKANFLKSLHKAVKEKRKCYQK